MQNATHSVMEASTKHVSVEIPFLTEKKPGPIAVKQKDPTAAM